MVMEKKVKSVTLHKTDFVAGDVTAETLSEKTYKYSYTEFDAAGNPVKEIRYNQGGGIEEKYEYGYDENGKRISETDYLDEHEIAERKKIIRDEKGDIISVEVHYQDGSVDTTTYSYNQEGKPVEKTTTNDEGEVEMKEVNEYDMGKLVKKEQTEEGELILRETYHYREDGNIESSARWTLAEDILFENKFDKKGNIVESKKYDEDRNLLGVTRYDIDENGKVTGMAEETGFGITRTSIEYDESGNPVKQEELDPEGNLLSRIERKFDENGNVTESRVFIDFMGRAVNQNYLIRYEYEYH